MFHYYTDNPTVNSIHDLTKYTNSTYIGVKYLSVVERLSFYKNCTITPYNFYVVVYNNKIVRDCGGGYKDDIRISPNQHWINKNVSLDGYVYYIDDAWGNNFHHWLWDCISKLIKFINLKQKIKDLKLFIRLYIFSEKEFRQILDYVNIPFEDIMLADPYFETLYTCKGVYVPNPTSVWEVNCFEEPEKLQIFDLFKKVFFDPKFKDKDKYEKIYITRCQNSLKPNATRKILNINEVHKFFEYFGYTILNTDNLSFYERVNYFFNCKYMVCEHGGGANHVFFTQPGVKFGIINYDPISNNHPWLSYKDYDRDIFEIKDVCNLMEDKFVMKYPVCEPFNFKIQQTSKPWCLDLYTLENALRNKKMI